ncbi:H-2 class I histocompatibility antigen%2C Q10 alpha chain-like isoform X1 [Xyrichtys novacula]|uniref:H-2 class I histocompatibility antigen, Q10 alpha chain-like isoform X1 n=1 Tax=Xyrichtys novacula TaxID=13765 RepID=A0AAV1HC06_XYRNO|nr:H-2 class I histocompatibility antigen%2C Q10 alpha chain-like isoform X1 [Xyrichtys novacula]
MNFILVLVLLGSGLTVDSERHPERHSLMYMYSAFSKPIGLPGIHDFTAMGLLDNRMIDYYDSDIQRKVPKQDWMAERQHRDYWDQGTRSRQGKQKWFKENMEILMDRMRQSRLDIHTLQWIHGCEGEMQPDGTLGFLRGTDMYRYDGNTFLFLDEADGGWVAASPAAEPNKRKWDGVQVSTEYLKIQCIDWLRVFVTYLKEQLRTAKPPTVRMFAVNSNVKTTVVLTCLATGFLSKETDLFIKMDGYTLTRKDGIRSTGTLPNDDNTFQRRDSVEILRGESGTFTCEVSHRVSNFSIIETWDKSLPPDSSSANSAGIIAVAVPVLFGLIGLIVKLVLLYKKGVFDREDESPEGDESSNTGREEFQLTEELRGSIDSGVSTAASSGISCPTPESEILMDGKDLEW